MHTTITYLIVSAKHKSAHNIKINSKKLTGRLFPNQGEMDRLIMPHKEMCCPFFQYYKDATFSKESFNNKKKTSELVTCIVHTKFTSLVI